MAALPKYANDRTARLPRPGTTNGRLVGSGCWLPDARSAVRGGSDQSRRRECSSPLASGEDRALRRRSPSPRELSPATLFVLGRDHGTYPREAVKDPSRTDRENHHRANGYREPPSRWIRHGQQVARVLSHEGHLSARYTTTTPPRIRRAPITVTRWNWISRKNSQAKKATKTG